MPLLAAFAWIHVAHMRTMRYCNALEAKLIDEPLIERVNSQGRIRFRIFGWVALEMRRGLF
jgi:hypothetical protein